MRERYAELGIPLAGQGDRGGQGPRASVGRARGHTLAAANSSLLVPLSLPNATTPPADQRCELITESLGFSLTTNHNSRQYLLGPKQLETAIFKPHTLHYYLPFYRKGHKALRG